MSTQVLTYAKTYFNKTLLTKSFKTVLQSTIDYSYVLTETSNQQKQHGQIRSRIQLKYIIQYEIIKFYLDSYLLFQKNYQ